MSKINSASNPDQPNRLAPQHLRMFALIVDYLLILALLKFWEQLTLGTHWDLQPQLHIGQGPSPGWFIGMGLLVLCRDLTGGRSPGKWLAGISIGKADDLGKSPPIWNLVLRNALLVLLPVEGVLVFTDPYCRRLGDKVAGTVVVIPARETPPMRRLLLLSILFLSTLLASFLLARMNLYRSSAYQTAERAILADADVARQVGNPVEPGSNPNIEWPPLESGADEERVTVTLGVEGPHGEAEAVAVLVMGLGKRKWTLESVKLKQSESNADEQKAP